MALGHPVDSCIFFLTNPNHPATHSLVMNAQHTPGPWRCTNCDVYSSDTPDPLLKRIEALLTALNN